MTAIGERRTAELVAWAALALGIELALQAGLWFIVDALGSVAYFLGPLAVWIWGVHETLRISPLVVFGPSLAIACLRSSRLGLIDRERLIVVARWPLLLRVVVLAFAVATGTAVGGESRAGLAIGALWMAACIAHVSMSRLLERDARGPKRARLTGVLGGVDNVLVVAQTDPKMVVVKPAPEAPRGPTISSYIILRELA